MFDGSNTTGLPQGWKGRREEEVMVDGTGEERRESGDAAADRAARTVCVADEASYLPSPAAAAQRREEEMHPAPAGTYSRAWCLPPAGADKQAGPAETREAAAR